MQVGYQKQTMVNQGTINTFDDEELDEDELAFEQETEEGISQEKKEQEAKVQDFLKRSTDFSKLSTEQAKQLFREYLDLLESRNHLALQSVLNELPSLSAKGLHELYYIAYAEEIKAEKLILTQAKEKSNESKTNSIRNFFSRIKTGFRRTKNR